MSTCLYLHVEELFASVLVDRTRCRLTFLRVEELFPSVLVDRTRSRLTFLRIFLHLQYGFTDQDVDFLHGRRRFYSDNGMTRNLYNFLQGAGLKLTFNELPLPALVQVANLEVYARYDAMQHYTCFSAILAAACT